LGREIVVALQTILDEAVAKKRAPGFGAAVRTRDGQVVTASAGVKAAGAADPVDADTIFWIASCSKAITSVAALQLVERGLLDLDAPVGELLPVLAAPQVLTGFDADDKPILKDATRPITLRHLLSHTSGLAYDFTSEPLFRYMGARGESLQGVMDPSIPLVFEPGEGWQYGIGIDWTGRLIEKVTGQSLDSYVAQHILQPLGMKDTTYFPNAEQAARKSSVHAPLPDGSFVTIPFGMPDSHHFMMGGGGLFSTPSDYLKFLTVLATGGAPLLKPETFALMLSNQTGEMDAGIMKPANPAMAGEYVPLPGQIRRHGLAGLLNMDEVPGGRSAGSTAWAGLANCYYWADPATGAAGVLMAQVLPFGNEGVIDTFDKVEKAVYA
jgi:CubicO group peptidase (beta-lactamase class C family)